ncbi:MAG: hypothetical protein J3K34DRAFT_459882 [Monoraphidium minutum]|nr:MAG: hypothetical protein J3K34DRAFT_459882 [Monoraphidium minutum]
MPAMGSLQHDMKLAFDAAFPAGPLPPLWANTTSIETAVKGGTLGVGYSGSGLLLFYFIGVSKVLQQLGVIKPGTTRVAGTSGGIIGCAPDFGIVDHDKFLAVGKDFVSRCRSRNNCMGTLDAEVDRVLEQLLPPDAASIVNGTAYILYASPDDSGVPIGNWTSTYGSRDDLAQAIRTGVYIPMWSGPSMTRMFRGKRAYDGGFRRALPCPPNVTYCVTASVLPPLDFHELLDTLSEPHTARLLRRALSSTLGAKPMQFVRSVVAKNRQKGYKADEVVLGTVAYLTAVNPGPDVHIYPGKYNKNPYSMWEWILMMIIPPTPAEVDTIVKMGADDATSWAREQGLLPPAGRRLML